MKIAIGLILTLIIPLFLISGIRVPLLRGLLRLPAPVITGEQAVAIARREFAVMGHGELHRQGLHTWTVRAVNAENEPLDVFIDNQTGRILGLGGWLEAGPPPEHE
ncbi:MAG: hypothetical protein ACM3QZ_12285 [Solirubrobacterales bacterium]